MHALQSTCRSVPTKILNILIRGMPTSGARCGPTEISGARCVYFYIRVYRILDRAREIIENPNTRSRKDKTNIQLQNAKDRSCTYIN